MGRLVASRPTPTTDEAAAADAMIEGALANILPLLDGLPFPVSAEAVAADFRSMVVDDVATTAVVTAPQPVHLIRAEHGVAPDLPPIVDDLTLEEVTAGRVGPLTSERVAGATHFSLLGEHSAAVVRALATR